VYNLAMPLPLLLEVRVIPFDPTVRTNHLTESEYIERLEINPSSDQTLGIGASPTEATYLLLTATTMMKATVNITAIQSFNKESGRAELIKSTMTQAILYGSLPNVSRAV
jgi:nuclear pore complex protein Nup133